MNVSFLSGVRDFDKCRTVLCLGNFDGIHLGHRALIEEAKARTAYLAANDENVICGVLTFSEPTQRYLCKVPPPRLMDMTEKAELFREDGIDVLITCDFTAIRNMTPAEFVERIVLDACHCVRTVCGFNYHFGAKGAGDRNTLSELMGGRASVVEPVMYRGEAISSSAIRRAVEDGDVEAAAGMLGRLFSIEDEVKHGRAVGTGLGFATLNQYFRPGFLVPKHGVYITSCEFDGKIHPAISNVGTHPTFGEDERVVCETHILDYSGDLYGKRVKTMFHKFLRPEMRFDNPDVLVETVKSNIETAKEYFRK